MGLSAPLSRWYLLKIFWWEMGCIATMDMQLSMVFAVLKKNGKKIDLRICVSICLYVGGVCAQVPPPKKNVSILTCVHVYLNVCR